MELRLVSRAERATELEGDPQCPGRVHGFAVFANQADARGGDPLTLYEVGQSAHGRRTRWSDRNQQSNVDAVVSQQAANLLAGLLHQHGAGNATHEGVVPV